MEWVAISFPRGPSDPETELGSPAVHSDSLLSEPPGKLKTSSILLEKKNYDSEPPCCLLDLRKEAFSFSHVSTVSPVEFHGLTLSG